MKKNVDHPPRGFEVRLAAEQDAAAVRALRLDALRLHPTAFTADLAMCERETVAMRRERLAEMLGSEEGAIFVAVAGDDVFVMAGVRRGDRPKTRHNGAIWGVYVREAWRGRRAAEGLVQMCLAWARANALRLLKLEVNQENEAAIRCYQRCGFSTYGVDPWVVEYDGRLYDSLMMVRRVD